MKAVFVALLSEHSLGKVNNPDLFSGAVALQKSMSKPQYTPQEKAEARSLAFDFCQMIKNSTAVPIVISYPTGLKRTYNDKQSATSDVTANFDDYYTLT